MSEKKPGERRVSGVKDRRQVEKDRRSDKRVVTEQKPRRQGTDRRKSQ